MNKEKITITFTDRNGEVFAMEEEFDIDRMDHVDVMEKELDKINAKSGVFLMRQAVKKNKKFLLPYLWHRILALFGMGPLSYKSSAWRSDLFSEDKNSAEE